MMNSKVRNDWNSGRQKKRIKKIVVQQLEQKEIKERENKT